MSDLAITEQNKARERDFNLHLKAGLVNAGKKDKEIQWIGTDGEWYKYDALRDVKY